MRTGPQGAGPHISIQLPGARTVNRPVLDRGLADAQTSNTGDWIDGVIEHCRCPGRKHRPTVIRWIGKDGRRKTRGIPTVLAESAAYPRRMGQRIYACHTGQYIAQRPAAKSQRQQTTTTGKQPRASSARVAKSHVPASIFYVQRPTPRCRLALRQCRNRGTGCTLAPMHLRPSRVTSLACGRSPVPPDGDSNVQTIGLVFVAGSRMCLCMLLEVEQRI